MAVDFNVLVENARFAQSKVGEQALWKAAFELPCWYFLGVGEGDDMQPLCAVAEGHAHLLAFTDEERAQSAADARGEREPAAVVHMEIADAIDYCRALDEAQDVVGMFFNNGQYGFGAPLLAIIDRYKRFSRGT
jgi:hypothetical protein